MPYRVINKKLYKLVGFVHLVHWAVPKIIEKTSDHQWHDKDLVFIENLDVPDGYYRKRRNKWVKIPDSWVGHFPTKCTKRKRQTVSRRTRKEK